MKRNGIVKKLIRDCLTGRNNRTYDLGRIMWFQGVQAFILITVYSIYKGYAVDMAAWGTGLAALLFGGGAGLAMKAATEPTTEETKPVPDFDK